MGPSKCFSVAASMVHFGLVLIAASHVVAATVAVDCDADAMALESEYVAALGKAATYEITGDRLTLRDASGAMQVTYVLTS